MQDRFQHPFFIAFRTGCLWKTKAAGTEYITITEALKIFTTSRLTVIRLVHSKNIRCFKTSPKRWFVCVKDLEALFPLRSTPIVVETPKASQVFDMNPKNCYTIGEITKRFGITESSITLGMKWQWPLRNNPMFIYQKQGDNNQFFTFVFFG